VNADPLPRSAPLGLFERSRAILGTEAFVLAVPGPAVLIRLDERGGPTEAVPWAFPSTERLEAALDGDGDGGDGGFGDDVFVDPAFVADSEEATATGPSQPPLALPPARERASVVVVPVGGGPVGRAATSAVRVQERSVSRQHAVIGIDEDGGFSIVDLDSDNGTGVNGMLLVPGTSHTLRSGDVVHLGDVSFLFLDVDGLASHLPALTGA
jgi:hypothetical protein